jgi:hypothetical protein
MRKEKEGFVLPNIQAILSFQRNTDGAMTDERASASTPWKYRRVA